MQLQSKLVDVYDITKLQIPNDMLSIKVDSHIIDNLVNKIKAKYLTIKEVDNGIENGDVVSVRLCSEIDKYNQLTQISIGKKYFDESLENQMLGMKKKDKKTIDIDGKNVDVEVISDKRRILADLTDELIKKENIESVNTVQQYKEYIQNNYIEKLKKNQTNQIIEWVKNEYLQNCKFDIVVSDEEYVTNEYRKKLNQMASKHNTTYEDIIVKLAGHYCGTKTFEDGEKALMDMELQKVKVTLLGEELSKDYDFVVNEDTYEKDMQKKAENEGISVETIKSSCSYLDYLDKKYNPFVFKQAKEFCSDRLDFNIMINN